MHFVDVQRRLAAQFAAEGVEIDADVSDETEAVMKARQAAEATARAEELRIAQLGVELAAIEKAELDFEQESEVKAVARHAARSITKEIQFLPQGSSPHGTRSRNEAHAGC